MIDSYISPVYSILIDVIKGISGPVIFVSLLVSICTLDNLETMKSKLKRIFPTFFIITLIMFFMALVACLAVFGIPEKAGVAFNTAKLLSLLLTLIPTNILQPFIEGNMIQIVVLGCISGFVLLILGEKSVAIRKLVGEFKFSFFSVLELAAKLLPLIVFLSVVTAVSTIQVSDVDSICKIIVLDLELHLLLSTGFLLVTAGRFKVSTGLLLKE